MRRSTAELRMRRTASEPGELIEDAMAMTAAAKLPRMVLTTSLEGGLSWATLSQSFCMDLMAAPWYWGFDPSLRTKDFRRARKSVVETRCPREVRTAVRMGWVWV